jgi:hypothetical protein
VVTSDGRPLPEKPRAAQPVPASVKPSRMLFMPAQKAEDTTGDGYPDEIRATVALFSAEHAASLRHEGVFVFKLFPRGEAGVPGAEPIAMWRIEGEAIEQAHAVSLYGPIYQFRLSLIAANAASRPLSFGDLRCRFEPADGGPPVHSEGVRSIQIGRRARG